MDVATIRALEPVFADTSAYPDATITSAIAIAQSLFERFLGFGLTTTTRTETIDGNGTRNLFVSKTYVTALTSVTVNGEAKTCTFNSNGRITAPSGDWFASDSSVVVQFSHGINPVPASLNQAWGWYVRYLLLHAKSRIDDRTTTMSDGEMTFSLAQPGENRPTGLPAVDAVLKLWRYPNAVA